MRQRRIFQAVTALSALVLSELALASDDYRCTIERFEDSFSIDKSIVEARRAVYVGKQFTVERRTGIMAGVLKNSFFTSPQVIDRGSSENSFKAVTTMRKDQGPGGGSFMFTLIIGEYLDTKKKPFVVTDDGTLFFGTCEHF